MDRKTKKNKKGKSEEARFDFPFQRCAEMFAMMSRRCEGKRDFSDCCPMMGRKDEDKGDEAEEGL